jgi:SAM-dependent methyltransferase
MRDLRRPAVTLTAVPFATSHTEIEAELLARALPENATVLEAGCGRRSRLAEHRGRIARLVGVDLDVEAGRENSAVDEFVAADLGLPLPFPDGTFDLVYANFVVEHLESPITTFREWRRVLRPNGSLVLLTSNAANPYLAAARVLPERGRVLAKGLGPGVAARDVFRARYRANTPKALTALARAAGFEVVELVYVATLHRYAGERPALAKTLRAAEHVLPSSRRSTIVGWFRAA